MRYDKRPIELMQGDVHKELRKRRGVERVAYYSSPAFSKISKELSNPDNLEFHIWGIADKFYKIAAEHYGDPRLWWVIAFFNKKPTDAHAKIGDVIYVPKYWEPIFDAIVEHETEY